MDHALRVEGLEPGQHLPRDVTREGLLPTSPPSHGVPERPAVEEFEQEVGAAVQLAAPEQLDNVRAPRASEHLRLSLEPRRDDPRVLLVRDTARELQRRALGAALDLVHGAGRTRAQAPHDLPASDGSPEERVRYQALLLTHAPSTLRFYSLQRRTSTGPGPHRPP